MSPTPGPAADGEDTALRWPLADDERDGQTALFGVDEALTVERGTGRMSGLEFLPVTAKRILNEVPASSSMPFRWTINAYRGCSHSCVYCLVGDTSILMADGRVKPLADIRAGDRVYGTECVGSYRRYVATTVLAHWSTAKPAYRVTLGDGTVVTGSGDHRLLTRRGWKYIVDDPHRGIQRPHLTLNDTLLGIGQLARRPAHDAEYRRGYLTGMIRGDGNLATYSYDRPRRGRSTVYRFRLALVDPEPLERTRQYLEDIGIVTTSFTFSAATETRKQVEAIRTSRSADYDLITRSIEWPTAPSDAWRLGFLAGIFDAEGGHNGGTLRISNSDPEILQWISLCLAQFGFAHKLEGPSRNGVCTIRITGGLSERLRFFISVDVATTRKRTIDNVAIKSAADLAVVSIEDLGIKLPMYDITTESGDFIANGVVSHNCFARPTHDYLGLGIGADFDRKIVVKVNAVDKLRAELRSPRWAGEGIAMGTNTDPYQRAEGKYRLTRGIVQALGEAANPFSILTKSALVLRDLDVLTAAAQRTQVNVSFSIGTLDERAWRATEPGAPHPQRRVDAIRTLTDAGIEVGVLIAPILPGMSDSRAQLTEVIDAVVDAGASSVTALALHLRPGVREHFLRWLSTYDSELHARYLAAYVDGSTIDAAYRQWLSATTRSIIDSAVRRRRARPGAQLAINEVDRAMRSPAIGPLSRTAHRGLPPPGRRTRTVGPAPGPDATLLPLWGGG